MKNIITIILSAIMLMTTSTVVFAETLPYYQSTRMSYEVPGSFTAVIPAEMNAGDSVSVSVRDVNLAEGSQIATSICYLDENDEIKLTNSNETDHIAVKVFDRNGNQYTRGCNLVGMFTEDNQTYTVSTEVQSTDGAKAGMYTGYMCFEFEIVDV